VWVRPEEDKVPPELAHYIFRRDRICIARRKEGSAHICRTRFGDVHEPDDWDYLTLEHVKLELRAGKRAEPTKRTLTLACGWANNEGWCSANRIWVRDYIYDEEPDE
jgi:hypothetical protein